ncbi:MAG: FAD-dependent oxidoreductase [Coriobacteriia bacterium]|nr:FAD-dependent oxidoreductase [Coriobacteriia bacterium]
MEIKKQVNVVGNYDVVVCGGGPAGFIAAIAASRQGAKTAIIEEYGFLGGMATSSFVTPISVFTYKGELVIGGIPWEFMHKLSDMGGARIEEPLGNVAFEPEMYKLLCQRYMQEENIDMYMHSYISDVVVDGRCVTYVVFENKNGTEALSAKKFIDCTGDADVAYMAGCDMQDPGDTLQPMSSYFILGGCDTDSPMLKEAMCHNKTGENCHCLPVREKLLELDIGEFGGPWFCTTLQPGVVTVNMTRTEGNAIDNRDFTKAECKLREECFRMAKILKDNVDEFKDSYVLNIATHGGIRETRRIVGAHTITAEEYVGRYEYEDSVSRGAHPIDIHVAHGANQNITFLESPAYVPYRALYSSKFDNLLVAGRCISADKQAFASLRVQASCMGTGQAAGVAATQDVPVQNVDINKLREDLKEIGANL